MLGHGLAAHVQVLAQLPQGLAVFGVKPIEQEPAAGVGEGFKHLVHVRVHCAYYATM